MKAYHFLTTDYCSGSGNEPAWQVGETRRFKSKPVLCTCGYHSSPTLWDALRYAPGPVACLVDISRPVEKDATKYVSRRRTLVKAVNIERELRLFAAACAERVLHLYESEFPGDARPRKAIAAARDYANGKISWAAADAAIACAAADGGHTSWAAAAADAAWTAAAATAAATAATAARNAAAGAAYNAAIAADAATYNAAIAAADAAAAAAADAADAAAAHAAAPATSHVVYVVSTADEMEWQKTHFHKICERRLTEKEVSDE